MFIYLECERVARLRPVERARRSPRDKRVARFAQGREDESMRLPALSYFHRNGDNPGLTSDARRDQAAAVVFVWEEVMSEKIYPVPAEWESRAFIND
ncbi:hypothetical protein, partial [Rhodoblastus sp.]